MDLEQAKQRIRCAVGDPSFNQIEEVPNSTEGMLVFDLILPRERFKGLIPKWRVVVPSARQRVAANSPAWVKLWETIAQVHRESSQSRNHLPMLVLPHPNFEGLVESVCQSPFMVFSADGQLLPGRVDSTISGYETFFGAALRAKKLKELWNFSAISPFIGKAPPERWRFYGRNKELLRLIDSQVNCFVVGARRMGKTSLLQTAADELKRRGEQVIEIDGSRIERFGDLARRILLNVDPREAFRFEKHADILGEKPLSLALRALERENRRVVIFVDEIGKLVEQSGPEHWKIIGLLRYYSQRRHLRLVFSCYDEIFIKQMASHDTPWKNFGDIMPVGYLSDQEFEEFLIEPLRTWARLNEQDEISLRRLIAGTVGKHPYFLQSFGEAWFRSLSQSDSRNFIDCARSVFSHPELMKETFKSAVDETFSKIGKSHSLLRSVFLTRCHEIHRQRTSLKDRDDCIDDTWVKGFLLRNKYDSSFEARRILLESLEMYGLTAPEGANAGLQRIGVPLIYSYLLKTETSIEDMIKNYTDDIRRETAKWQIEPLPA